MLAVKKVTGGYKGRNIVKDINFNVQAGEFFGILGPNGSGKTTLLKMISGALPISKGSIHLLGKDIFSYSAKERARLVAVLPQLTGDGFSYSVQETVLLGRYAHQSGLFQMMSQEDEAIVKEVMIQTGVFKFKQKSLHELSGGEQQRVFLAQALAQRPKVLLLDEPTNHLDLAYQKELLDFIKKMTIENKLTVISVFHDINLTSLYCDRILLIENGRMEMTGSPSEVITEEHIQHVYQTIVKEHFHPTIPKPQLALIPNQMNAEADIMINDMYLKQKGDCLVLESPIRLKTMSSAVMNPGVGWFQTFVNRHVSKNYSCENHHEEMAAFLTSEGFLPENTVGMMTAVMIEDAVSEFVMDDGFSLFIVVTAGVGNAVDVSKGDVHSSGFLPGTINTWVFINGELSDEAYIQAIATATEAKVKVLHDLKIEDPLTGTIATGTSTDSILIAATQKGKRLQYAGSVAPLGKVIGPAVYRCIKKAIEKTRERTVK
ncbi:ABC transporter ATP-binding protein [Heyndrickxia shackletonii]|uniref:ABC transporter ATP-binding protein n=1 Tax=Heyndrickxia shackletonii TaxID=157838 RepID=A0A0Q3WYI8_9BACI|nr:adenosylcobinamide amidohydrolase [Heyndrickxia shackletonii]KQL54252.1 ABC transporter ATP-binding protein [Heyndrickxia shackletonii]NEZ00940.1 ATP-binding cassette domain-containing protein [Heyndrickxia shackletonii]